MENVLTAIAAVGMFVVFNDMFVEKPLTIKACPNDHNANFTAQKIVPFRSYKNAYELVCRKEHERRIMKERLLAEQKRYFSPDRVVVDVTIFEYPILNRTYIALFVKGCVYSYDDIRFVQT